MISKPVLPLTMCVAIHSFHLTRLLVGNRPFVEKLQKIYLQSLCSFANEKRRIMKISTSGTWLCYHLLQLNPVYFAGNFALEEHLMAFDSSRAAVDDVSTSTKSTWAAEMEQLLGGVQMEQED